jgi:cytochrome c oxidase subunit III
MGDAHAHDHKDAGHGHDAHGHGHGDPNLAHHFDTMDQQIESGKMGMWLFLATEVLLFAGLFCFYAVYRANHPEIFKYASQYLNMWMGGLNTLILLASSFTAAAAVTYAQRRDRQKLVICLVLTLVGALGFLVVKYFEYSHKFHAQILWGPRYAPTEPPSHAHHAEKHDAARPALVLNPTIDWTPAAAPGDEAVQAAGVSVVKVAPNQVQLDKVVDGRLEAAAPPPKVAGQEAELRNVHIFFGVYFIMTGLHGLHVLFGMGAISWVLLRAMRGDFDGGYYLPVDLVALYWHLVDLIWIYLFPLLYLI